MVFGMTSKYVMSKSGIVNLINLCCSLEWKDKDLSDKREIREAAKQDYDALTESLSTLQKRVEKQNEFILSVREAMELHESHHKIHIERALAELDAE